MTRFLSMLKWLIFTPPPPAPPPPDWSAFSGYYDLGRAIAAAGPMSADAFLDGPFTRYLELSSTGEHPRLRARTMEFATYSLRRQREGMAERSEAVEDFEARAWALAHRYLDAAPNGDYMIEVLEGRATHNYRTPALPGLDDSATLPPPRPAL